MYKRHPLYRKYCKNQTGARPIFVSDKNKRLRNSPSRGVVLSCALMQSYDTVVVLGVYLTISEAFLLRERGVLRYGYASVFGKKNVMIDGVSRLKNCPPKPPTKTPMVYDRPRVDINKSQFVFQSKKLFLTFSC